MSYASPLYLRAAAVPIVQRDTWSLAGIAVFLLGMSSSLPIQTVGKVYVGEIIIAGISLFCILQLLSAPSRFRRVAFSLLATLIVSLSGYVLSDLYRHTPTADYLRGWFRWVMMGTDFIFLAWLASKNMGHFIRFLVGLEVMHACLPVIMPQLRGTPQWLWKFHIALPLIIVVLYLLRRRNPMLVVMANLVIGLFSIAFAYRSFGLICLMTAALLMSAIRRTNKPVRVARKSSIVITGLLLLSATLGSVFLVYQFGKAYGLLSQFENSNMARWTSARVSWGAIINSPVVGYGSWARSPELAKLRDRILEKEAVIGHDSRSEDRRDLIIAHSQILQCWIEGGVLGLVFFFYYGYQLVAKTSYLAFIRKYDIFMPIMVTICLHAGWHYVFSPFKGTQRFMIASAAAIVCYLAQEIYDEKQARELQNGAIPQVYPNRIS